MNKKHKTPSPSSADPSNKKKKKKRNNPVFDALGPYIAHPETFDAARVVFHDEHFVAVHDRFPKASVHTLLLPRSKRHTLQHPFAAFEDADFLAAVRAQAAKLRAYVGGELQRRYGASSAPDGPREAEAEAPAAQGGADTAPRPRDWTQEVMVGVHAHPSMNHLHVHVLSVDRYADCLKHRQHYNSFATAFFVDLADFPLARDDPRRTEHYLRRDLTCWRCGENFGVRFAKLKAHLKEEFEQWKKA